MKKPIAQIVLGFCNQVREFHYCQSFEYELLEKRATLIQLIEYIGNHSSLIAGAAASNESNPALAMMADHDARAGDYLSTILSITESMIKDYLLDLGCGLSNLDEDEDCDDEEYLLHIASIMNWHNLDGPSWVNLLHELQENGDEEKLQRHCLAVAWLEATYFCANFRLQSFDGNCCSRWVRFHSSDTNFGNYVGMAEPKIRPWIADYLDGAYDLTIGVNGAGGRIDMNESIFEYLNITNDWIGKMQPLKAARLWNDL